MSSGGGNAWLSDDASVDESDGFGDFDRDRLGVDDLREAADRVVLQKWKENNEYTVFIDFGGRVGVVRMRAEKWYSDSPNIIQHRIKNEFGQPCRITEAQWRDLRRDWRNMCEVLE